MKCAIEIILDDASQNRINKVRQKLQKSGVRDEALKLNHISLADIDINETQIALVKKLVKTFAENHKKLSFTLTVAGSFMTDENVLFLAPIMTEELANYNSELIDLLTQNNVECGKYYTKNNWFPHCTVAIRLSDEELKKGFAVLKDYNILPLTVVGDKIDILCYDPKPYKQLAIFDLKI